MCKMASFIWRRTEEDGLQVKVWKLDGHAKTYKHFDLSKKQGWMEGHYLPRGKIACRILEGADKVAEEILREKYPTFNNFLKWCLTQEIDLTSSLYLSGCDLKGVKLPESVGGWLDLSGCDLKGVKLPKFGEQIYR